MRVSITDKQKKKTYTHMYRNALSALFNYRRGKWDRFLAYGEILPFSNKAS